MHLEENVPLAPLTTLRIGGNARYYVRALDELDVWEASAAAKDGDLKLFTLGGGSNLVVPDEGFPGLVLHATIGSQIHFDGEFCTVDAGTDWNALVLHLCKQGIAGMECLAGIPGLVGGAPIQNIGAYGQEVSQTIDSVRALDLQTLTFVNLPNRDCHFAYRTSIFNSTHRNRYIVTSVRFRLDANATPNLTYADLRKHFGPNAQPTPLEVYTAVRHIRDRKGMLIDPSNPTPDSRSAGSFFKNPIVPSATLTHIAQALSIPETAIPHWPAGTSQIKLPAAWLIEHAGFPKGFSLSPESPVAISSRHTLALINRSGAATCAELLSLRDHIAATVLRRFTISLEQEPITLTP